MRNLAEIEQRHGKDRWLDAGFILVAVLLIAISVGALAAKNEGKASRRIWTVTVIESPMEVVQP